MRTRNEKQNFKINQRKLMQQPLLFTSLRNRHTLSTAALPDGLCSLIFSNVTAWDHPVSFVLNFLLHRFIGRSGGPMPYTMTPLPAEKSNRVLLLPVNRQQTDLVSFLLSCKHLSTSDGRQKNWTLKEKYIWPLGKKQNDLRVTWEKLVCVERKD